MKPKTRKLIKRITVDFLMYGILIISLFPIFWMVVTSLKSNYDILLGKVGFSRLGNAIMHFQKLDNKILFSSEDGVLGEYQLDNKKYKILFDGKAPSSEIVFLNNEKINITPTKIYKFNQNGKNKEELFKIKNIPWKISKHVRNIRVAIDNNRIYIGKTIIKTKEEEEKTYKGQNLFEGIMVFDQNFNFIKNIQNKDIIINSNTTALLAHKNKLLIGNKDGLVIYDTKTNSLIKKYLATQIPNLKHVKKIIYKNGYFWVASSKGIFYLYEKGNVLRKIYLKEKLDEINTIEKYKKYLFIGTVNGIYKLDIINGNIETFYKDKAKYWNVTSILATKDVVWVGLNNGMIAQLSNNNQMKLQSSYKIRKGKFDIRWENYISMWENISFGTYLKNSVLICTITVIIALLMSTTAGYALSRFKFPGASLFSSSILAVNMIPPLLILIPIYLMYIKFDDITGIKLVGTYPGIIALYATWFIPMSIWILRSFFAVIPVEIEEAARIDGCNRFQIFWKIALPLAMPGIIATGIYIFLVAWDELIFATILLPQKEMLTIPLGIKLYIGNHQNRFDLMMAAATIATLPVLLMFFLVQRWFIKGLTAGAVKG